MNAVVPPTRPRAKVLGRPPTTSGPFGRSLSVLGGVAWELTMRGGLVNRQVVAALHHEPFIQKASSAGLVQEYRYARHFHQITEDPPSSYSSTYVRTVRMYVPRTYRYVQHNLTPKIQQLCTTCTDNRHHYGSPPHMHDHRQQTLLASTR